MRANRSDIMVLLLSVAVALCALSATGPAGRRRAREALCQSNLRRWGAIFDERVQDNDGLLFPGLQFSSYYWIEQLDDRLKDRKKTRIWLCPEADRPLVDEDGEQTPGSNVFNAWGIYSGYNYGPDGLAGSYGLNGYCIPLHDWSTYEGGVVGKDGWRDFDEIPQPEAVPLFVDALRFDLWPLDTDPPAQNEFAAWSANNMARCAINRHRGAINSLFADGSVRKVGLKELWTLRWHRSFDTEGPWTLAGGVTPADWPEWIRGLKDY